MRYWLDTEFIEDGVTIDLISIGIVCDDGREYYACNDECNLFKANQWVKDNVLIHLPPKHIGVNPGNPDVSPKVRQDILMWKTRDRIKEDLLLFFAGGVVDSEEDQSLNWDQAIQGLEIWGYYADYVWVVFCQLFGTMMDLPEGFPMYCRDIKQWCDELGNPKLPEQGKGEHHALADARWNKQAWDFLANWSKAGCPI